MAPKPDKTIFHRIILPAAILLQTMCFFNHAQAQALNSLSLSTEKNTSAQTTTPNEKESETTQKTSAHTSATSDNSSDNSSSATNLVDAENANKGTRSNDEASAGTSTNFDKSTRSGKAIHSAGSTSSHEKANFETGTGSDHLDGNRPKNPDDNQSWTFKARRALDKKPGFKVNARLYTLWTIQDNPDESLHRFQINMARVGLKWTGWKLIEAAIKVETNQLITGDKDTTLLRDLYVQVQPLFWLGIKMGQFKKPFSKIETTSRKRLPAIKRGVANDYIVEHLLYGGRDVGAVLTGRIWKKIKLDYEVGVFNGMGIQNPELGETGFKDIVARLDAKPSDWLSLGISYSVKFIEDNDLKHFIDPEEINLAEGNYPLYVNPNDPDATYAGFIDDHSWMTNPAWMTGMDLKLNFRSFDFVVDGMFGENWWFEKYPYIWSLTTMASYKHQLVKNRSLWIEPMIKGDFLSILSSMTKWRNHMWQLSGGVNLHIGRYLRLMVQGEMIFVQGTEADIDGAPWKGLWPNEWPGDWTDSKQILTQLAFSY